MKCAIGKISCRRIKKQSVKLTPKMNYYKNYLQKPKHKKLLKEVEFGKMGMNDMCFFKEWDKESKLIYFIWKSKLLPNLSSQDFLSSVRHSSKLNEYAKVYK